MQCKVELLDWMGDDLAVVDAARVSFAKKSDWVQGVYSEEEGLVLTGEELPVQYEPYEEYVRMFDDKHRELTGPMLAARDEKLINRLAKHNHWSPFSHNSLKFRIKAPIFLARQLGKHQVGLVWNEVSRRYVDNDPEFYVPTEWRERAKNVKQGSGKGIFSDDLIGYSQHNYYALEYYKHLLDFGICPEQARMVLPQSMMTEWIWTGSLVAFHRICKLRMDEHAQKENLEVVVPISEACKRQFPVSWEALCKYG